MTEEKETQLKLILAWHNNGQCDSLTIKQIGEVFEGRFNKHDYLRN